MYAIYFTELAVRDLHLVAADLHRQWGFVWGNDRERTRNELRNSLITPLESDPYTVYSHELGSPFTRCLTIDKGYAGIYGLGYLVKEDEKLCLVFLIQATGDLSDLRTAATLRASSLGAAYRE